MHRHRSLIPRITARVAAPAVGALLVASTVLAAAPATAGAVLGTRPFVPMFTQFGNCYTAGQLNQLTGNALEQELTNLSTWYRHINNQGSIITMGTNCIGKGPSKTTFASKLTGRGMMISSYRNGSYTSQSAPTSPQFHEAGNLEQLAPLGISTFWPGSSTPYGRSTDTSTGGTLVGNLDASSTRVHVRVTAAGKPANSPGTWPYVSSRGTGLNPGAYSANSHDFVSWLRIGDEMMQITAPPTVSNGIISVPVRRGLWSTAAAAHGDRARVMSPVYIGSTSASSRDGGYNGAPVRNATTSPLRYGIKIWTASGSSWIAAQVKKEFDPTGNHTYQGLNTVWLDVSGCVQYNNADAFGHPVAGWDDPRATKLARDSWGGYQMIKYAKIREVNPGLRISANSLANTNDCTNNLLANHADAGSLENWLKVDSRHPLDWTAAMVKNFQIQTNNWPAEYWVRFDEDFTGSPAAYKRFAYGSLLLAKNANATKYMMGGNFGLSKPDQLYFWNWGAPLSATRSLADVGIRNTPLYGRGFANGRIIVNPTGRSVGYQLGGSYLDVNNLDHAGNPTKVTSVTVGPHDAAFLMHA